MFLCLSVDFFCLFLFLLLLHLLVVSVRFIVYVQCIIYSNKLYCFLVACKSLSTMFMSFCTQCCYSLDVWLNSLPLYFIIMSSFVHFFKMRYLAMTKILAMSLDCIAPNQTSFECSCFQDIKLCHPIHTYALSISLYHPLIVLNHGSR